MKIHFLGTGGSEGIPCLSCSCDACNEARKKPYFRRQRTGVLLEDELSGIFLVVDAGAPLEILDGREFAGVLLTHWHEDHSSGLFRLSWQKGPSRPLISPEPEKALALKKGLYAREARPFCGLSLGPFKVWPLPLRHSVPTWGYLVECRGHKAALLWDTKGLPPLSFRFLREKGPSLALVDATYPPHHKGKDHHNLDEAVATGLSVASEVFLLHFSHQNLSPWEMEQHLLERYPGKPVAQAFDGLIHDMDFPLELSSRSIIYPAEARPEKTGPPV